MSDENEVQLRNFSDQEGKTEMEGPAGEPAQVPAKTAGDGDKADGTEPDASAHAAADLEVVFDVPVKVSAVLGRSQMEVSDLLKLGKGTVVELDRKVGEAIDIYVNNRLVARGEVVLVDERLGVTMTEIIKSERN